MNIAIVPNTNKRTPEINIIFPILNLVFIPPIFLLILNKSFYVILFLPNDKRGGKSISLPFYNNKKLEVQQSSQTYLPFLQNIFSMQLIFKKNG